MLETLAFLAVRKAPRRFVEASSRQGSGFVALSDWFPCAFAKKTKDNSGHLLGCQIIYFFGGLILGWTWPKRSIAADKPNKFPSDGGCRMCSNHILLLRYPWALLQKKDD